MTDKLNDNKEPKTSQQKTTTPTDKSDNQKNQLPLENHEQSTEEENRDREKADKLVNQIDPEAPDGRLYQAEDFADTKGDTFLSVFAETFKTLHEVINNLFGENIKSYDDLKPFLDDPKYNDKFAMINDGDYQLEGERDSVLQSMDPDHLANALADKYKKITINIPQDGKFPFNKYPDGTRLGKMQCARYVSEMLGLKNIIYSAPQMFSRLCAKPDQNGRIANLKKDMSNLKVGDVLFFTGTFGKGNGISHAGIVSSTVPLMMKHHSTFLKGVQTANLNQKYYQDHFYAAVTPMEKNDPFFGQTQNMSEV